MILQQYVVTDGCIELVIDGCMDPSPMDAWTRHRWLSKFDSRDNAHGSGFINRLRYENLPRHFWFSGKFWPPALSEIYSPFPPPPPPPLNYEHSRVLHKISTDAPSPSSTQVTPASTLLPSTGPQSPIHPLFAQIYKNAPWETPCSRHQIHIRPTKAPPLPQQAGALCGP